MQYEVLFSMINGSWHRATVSSQERNNIIAMLMQNTGIFVDRILTPVDLSSYENAENLTINTSTEYIINLAHVVSVEFTAQEVENE